MGSRVTRRLATLAVAGIGALGMFGLTSGVAQATTPVLNRVAGTFTTEAGCNYSRAGSAATPGSLVAGCSYYPDADPSVNIPRAGWYFRYALPGDSGCAPSCTGLNPNPPSPEQVPYYYNPSGPGGGGCSSKITCDPH